MTEVQHLEPRNLSGKGGIGKGSKRRRGEDTEAFRRGWDLIFGNKDREIKEEDCRASSS